MNTPTRSQSLVQTKQHNFLSAFTNGAWVIAASLSIYFYLTMRTDMSGSEWLGSPLFGLPLLAVLMSAYYFVMRNKPVQPTMHIVAWSIILLLVTTANMLTLARFVFGGWKSFQALPIMGTFELILIAAGVHITTKEKSRGSLFIFLTWTVVLSLLTMGVFVGMAAGFQQPTEGIRKIGYVAGLGIGVWACLMLIAYLGFRSRFVSWQDALVVWAWCMCIGAIVSIFAGYFFLDQRPLIPFYSFTGTIIFASLATLLRMAQQKSLAAR